MFLELSLVGGVLFPLAAAAIRRRSRVSQAVTIPLGHPRSSEPEAAERPAERLATPSPRGDRDLPTGSRRGDERSFERERRPRLEGLPRVEAVAPVDQDGGGAEGPDRGAAPSPERMPARVSTPVSRVLPYAAVLVAVVAALLALSYVGPRVIDLVVALNARAPRGVAAVVLYVAMLLGMAGKTTWDAIEARRSTERIQVDPWAVAKPMIVSPIVFAVIWQARGSDAPLDAMALTFSFQNGFTWQTLLGRVVSNEKRTPRRASRGSRPGAVAAQG